MLKSFAVIQPGSSNISFIVRMTLPPRIRVPIRVWNDPPAPYLGIGGARLSVSGAYISVQTSYWRMIYACGGLAIDVNFIVTLGLIFYDFDGLVVYNSTGCIRL